MLRAIATLSILMLTACAATAFDFTPRYMIENADGLVIRRPYFADGKKDYAIRLYPDTGLSGQTGAALFTFAKFTYATMTWRQSPLTPGVPFDTAHLPQYSAAAVQFLPKGSADVKVESEEDNVFPINHWSCHRYTISYKFYGFPMRDTVTFLNLNDKEQLVIQVSSRDSDFQAIVGKSWDIIRSWHELESQPVTVYN
jgi:hypothetical protein